MFIERLKTVSFPLTTAVNKNYMLTAFEQDRCQDFDSKEEGNYSVYNNKEGDGRFSQI